MAEVWKTCVNLPIFCVNPRVNSRVFSAQKMCTNFTIIHSYVQNSTFPHTLSHPLHQLSHNHPTPILQLFFPLFHSPYYYNNY